jgi:hypothetical protein
MKTIPTFQFETLQNIPGFRHAVTTRAGGESEDNYASLNLGYHVDDNAATVTRNRRALSTALGYDATSLVAAQQTHGAHAEIVTAAMRGRGALDWESALPATDALIVGETNIPALILVADCAPLVLVDETHRVFALVHAGWRGAVARIASQTVRKMEGAFGSNPADIRVGIGPHLCAACFEIGDEVEHAAMEIAPQSIVGKYEKPHLDLRTLLRADVENSGVLPARIESMNRCPRCEVETFFSHRGQGGVAGRFGLVALWD